MATRSERSKAAALLGSKGGKAKSAAKAKAVRANGRKGGRPATPATLAGRRDGNAWDLEGVDKGQREGWDEATINAIGSTKFGKLCGLTDAQIEARGPAWGKACRQYNVACYKAVASRIG